MKDLNKIRIIAGKYKGRRLITPLGTCTTRPTSSRVRESIFNIIQDILPNSTILDLFAGSGALGLEALSRGAEQATFVDQSKIAIECLQKNIDSLEISNRIEVFLGSSDEFLTKKILQKIKKFDIIFIDPPYASDWYQDALQKITSAEICQPECTVIFEMSLATEIPLEKKPREWTKINARIYGKTKIEIWRYEPGTN